MFRKIIHQIFIIVSILFVMLLFFVIQTGSDLYEDFQSEQKFELNIMNKFYKNINDNYSLKKISSNRETYQYVRNNRKKKMFQMTDDQGSEDLFYYSGFLGKKTVGIEGITRNGNNKITKIFLN
ncbi:hypothetical protein WR164_03240 [Philodulcilactobacillus myokoensis]|uniref:Uncharacterized protein n=1 Tax=Philodulcilactobacillus myokoensis TaxID=2929573 RepID=A0A9W6AZP9_9LACO|nr:hypothetical protein [Philodulcilactobacillus myokoensis]GLB46345.1 hypothetical protein WR164_03240 [Philodulcilactobacillus myokoensis]